MRRALINLAGNLAVELVAIIMTGAVLWAVCGAALLAEKFQ